jgi:hypothetical protein
MWSIGKKISHGVKRLRYGIMFRRMREFDGKTVFVVLGHRVIPHVVDGFTGATIDRIMVEEETMEEYYLRHYGIQLKILDQECFVSELGIFLPPELCYKINPRSRA